MTAAFDKSVTFVVTAGGHSLDYYARKLGDRLPVAKLRVDFEQTSAEFWNVAFSSRVSVRGALDDAVVLERLRRANGLVHLPSHHLGRYGAALGKPYVITVHDLIRYRDMTRERPLIHRPNRRDRVYLRLDAAGIRRAAAILAVSQATKDEIVRHLGVAESRISVVHEGVDHEIFRPTEPPALDYRYLLHVGSEQPRKDLRSLLRALARLRRERTFRDLRLVKVGGPGGREEPFRESTRRAVSELGLEDAVDFVGRVPERELPRYYSGAACFVFPSLHEGFGLPPLEAMACGCPVVVSSAGSLPEVVGDAGLVFEPGDVEALARALTEVLSDRAMRKDLAARGLARARQFSWEKAANETIRVYEPLR